MQFINLKKQYLRIQESLEDSLKNILEKSNFIQGEQVQILEEKLSSYVGANCITVANGTDAIFIALRSLGIGRGDEVILPSFTWVSTAETVSLTGAKPVFCDIDPDTFNINIKEASQKITEKTKAIIVVSIFGQTADLISAKELCEDKGITLIEDAAQSFGAMHFNERSCSIADISTTSFFPSKPLGCYGDGGAIFWTNKKYEEKLKIIPRHGQVKRYDYIEVGVNSRLDTIQAAVLLEKLKIFDDEIIKRNEVAEIYKDNLSEIDRIIPPKINLDNNSVYALYTIKLKDINRDDLIRYLNEKSIPTGVYYPVPLHTSKPYLSNDTLANTTICSKNVLSLPMDPYLTEEEIVYICSSLKDFLDRN